MNQGCSAGNRAEERDTARWGVDGGEIAVQKAQGVGKGKCGGV